MRILVVEDEVQLAEAVARGLRREGMAVDVATDGDEGYRKAALTRYDFHVRGVRKARERLVVLEAELVKQRALDSWDAA